MAEKEYSNRNTKVTKKVNSETVPEWFNKKIESNSVSDLEEKEFLEKIKQARGEL